MKILIICHEFPPIGGGAGNATYYLARHFADKHHDVTVITSRFRNEYQKLYNFNVKYLPVLRNHADRTSPLELISFTVSGILFGIFNIRKRKYDICLAMHGIPSGWVALFLYKIFRIPYIISLRGGDVPGFLPESYDKLHKKINFITKLYWKNAAAIVANGIGLKELASSISDRMRKEILVIANGVDCAFFKPNRLLRDNSTIRILYSGRITLQKGLGCFVKALNNIIKSLDRFEVVFVGDGDLKENLEKESKELVNMGIVRFKKWLDKESLLKEYQKSHIFMLPSLYEGVSNSLLEAMACGCAVIASDIPGNKEFIKDGYGGFIFEPPDNERLGEILKYGLDVKNLSDIEEMGRRNRSAAEMLDWSKVADSYLKEMSACIVKS